MAEMILKYKKTILIGMIMAALISAVMMQFVKINYDLTSYLPKKVPSAIALDEIRNSFDDEIPNLNVCIPGISVSEAMAVKESLINIPGVYSVLWLDDAADIYLPLSSFDQSTVSSWYKNEHALFLVAGNTEQSTEVLKDIKEAVGEDAILSGPLLNQATIQTLSTGEVSRIIFYVIPLVLLVLFISTSSWFEPVLFLAAIGVAILINEGTNLFIGEISYVTQSTSAVLQLAVSMDYAVFLLHSFSRYRAKKYTVEKAMKYAIKESASSIAASAATTVFGFLALSLMKFKLGPNLGLVLAKGILFSFISVMLLLPVLAVYTTKLMDKTHHRSLLPSFAGFSKIIIRICLPLAIVFIMLIMPSFLAQKHNHFIYGSSGIHSEDSDISKNERIIEELFGQKQQMVLMVPEGDQAKESALSDSLLKHPDITSVISYSETVGSEIPPGFLSKEHISNFHSKSKSRIILYANTKDEGASAFALVEEIRRMAERYYGNSYHLLGQNVINYDLKDTIVKDAPFVNGAATLAIGMVLLITFKSLSLPFILLLTIKGAVWINLALPYFIGTHLNYVGFLIISSVQLGATVDYGILFANQYMKNRLAKPKKEAARMTIEKTAASILSPASILAIACLILGFVSTNGIIKELGLMLGRGAIISSLMVLTFLPALLITFDSIILKTTKNALSDLEG